PATALPWRPGGAPRTTGPSSSSPHGSTSAPATRPRGSAGLLCRPPLALGNTADCPGGADHHNPIRCCMTLRTPREATELDTLLSVEQAAERLGTSVRFVRRLVFQRRIPYVKLGRHVRIATSDLDAFIAAGRIEARRQPASPQRRSA